MSEQEKLTAAAAMEAAQDRGSEWAIGYTPVAMTTGVGKPDTLYVAYADGSIWSCERVSHERWAWVWRQLPALPQVVREPTGE